MGIWENGNMGILEYGNMGIWRGYVVCCMFRYMAVDSYVL